MTIGTEPPIIRYVYTGPATFDFNFRITDIESIAVAILNGTSGLIVLLELTTDYTVQIVDGVDGGTVTINPAATFGDGYIELRRDEPVDQETDFVNNDPFDMNILERTVDKLTMIAQQQKVAIELGTLVTQFRGVWVPNTAYRINNIVQYPDNQGNQYICQIDHTSSTDFNADLAAGYWALYLDVGFISEEANRASAAADAAAQSASEAAASASAASGSASQALQSQNAAKVSETNSKTSETNAKNSENSADQSEGFAHDWATKPSGQVNDGVNPPDFSAKYYAAAAGIAGSYTIPQSDALAKERESVPTSVETLDGPTTIDSPTTIKIEAGSGHQVDTYNVGTPETPVVTLVTWASQTISIPMPNDIGLVYIYLDINGIVNQHSGVPSFAELRENLYIATALYQEGVLTSVEGTAVIAQQQGPTLIDFIKFVDPGIKLQGFAITPNSDLTIVRDLGSEFGININYSVDPASPNVKSYPTMDPALFQYILSDGSVPNPNDVSILDVGDWENPLGTISSVPGGLSTIQYLFMSQNGNNVMMYGQTTYATLDDAKLSAAEDRLNHIFPPITNAFTLLAQIAVVQNATDLSDAAQASIINIASASASGSGSGSASTWTALSDTVAALIPKATPVVNDAGTVIQLLGSAVIYSDTEPSNPLPMQEWWDSSTGTKWIWIVDVDSGQWVDIDSPAIDYNLEEQLPIVFPPLENPALWNNRNILINGSLSGDSLINQREFDGNWSGLNVGDYGYDRWRKGVAANTIEQPVEAGNYRPNTVYTLSINGVIDSQPTSPPSGDWVVAVPDDATFAQLEEGLVMTIFEWTGVQKQLAMCQRYYWKPDMPQFWANSSGNDATNLYSRLLIYPTTMRAIPDLTYTLSNFNSVTIQQFTIGCEFWGSGVAGFRSKVAGFIADAEIH